MKKATKQKVVQVFVILAILGMIVSSFAGGLLSLY